MKKYECMMCLNEVNETEHLKIYVIGSEGLYICHSCKMILTNYVRQIRRQNISLKKEKWRKHNENKTNKTN